MRFTLQPRAWYAMELIFPSGDRHRSPIWVREAKSMKSGAGWLEISFWHAAYPEGVQDKCCALRVLARERGFLFATREFGEEGKAGVLLTEITHAWMRRHFSWAGTLRDAENLAQWLDQEAGRPGVGG